MKNLLLCEWQRAFHPTLLDMKIGRTVFLVSGSPPMEVTSKWLPDVVRVKWATKNGFTQLGSFPVQCLQTYQTIPFVKSVTLNMVFCNN